MFRVVGIGASAGGLESLEQFFKNLPPKPGMAFVVVQHLSPDFRSVMDELLARHCDLPIQHAQDNVEVELDRVYLLPPKKEMVIRNRRLLLTDKERTHVGNLGKVFLWNDSTRRICRGIQDDHFGLRRETITQRSKVE